MRGPAIALALLLLLLGGLGAYLLVRPAPARVIVEQGQTVTIPRGPTPEEAEAQRAESAAKRAKIEELQKKLAEDAAGAEDATDDPVEREPGADDEPGTPDPEEEQATPPRRRTADRLAKDMDVLLARKVSVAARGKSLPEVAQMIGEAAGFDVNVDVEGAERIPLTLQLEDVEARVALRTLAMIAGGLEIEIEDGHVSLRKKP